MNPAEQKALVIDTLRRRDHIAEQTRSRIAELERGIEDPLAHVDADVRREAEEEYGASIGRRRYVTSDGRVLFLTPEEIAQRRRAKAQRGRTSGEELEDPQLRRRVMMWVFNVVVVLLAIVVGWVLLR